MNKDELREWFYEKLFNCYVVKHKHKTEEHIKYLVYDKQFIRDCKLSDVLGDDIVFPTEHTGDILFKQDLKNKYLYCDYNKIWSFLESNYLDNYHEIQELTTGFLGEIDNYNQYTTQLTYHVYISSLGEIDNYNQYTTIRGNDTLSSNLGEIDNYNQYTNNYK